MPDQPSRTRRRMDYMVGAAKAAGSRAAEASALPAAEPSPAVASPEGLPFDPRFPGWSREGEFLFRRRKLFEGWAPDVWPRPFSPEVESAGELVFFDTETTGLSGGAGTVAFLFAGAWSEGPDLVVEQLFLSDFPGEPEFLQSVRSLLGRFSAFVSYNGRTFDTPLLKGRFSMNGIPWEPGPQVDLLHHARRLWKTVIGDCSLHSIETRVLGVQRDRDVPGEEIPQIWLQFLRTGRPGLLPVVFDHNTMDVASLARLYSVIGRLLEGEGSSVPVDGKALGSWLLHRAPSAGAALLADAYGRGDAGAAAVLSLHHKRSGDWERAVAMWESMLEGRSLFAAVELAKYHEHRSRRLELALRLVEQALAWNLPLDARARSELQKRRQRLRKRLAAIVSSGRAVR